MAGLKLWLWWVYDSYEQSYVRFKDLKGNMLCGQSDLGKRRLRFKDFLRTCDL